MTSRKSSFGEMSSASIIGIAIGIIIVIVIGYIMYSKSKTPTATTQSPTTQAPTTQSPTTQAPTTQAPTTTPAPVTTKAPVPNTFVATINTFMHYSNNLRGPWTQFTNNSQYLCVINLGDGTFGGLSNYGMELDVSIPTSNVGTLDPAGSWSKSANVPTYLPANVSLTRIVTLKDKSILGMGSDNNLYQFDSIYGPAKVVTATNTSGATQQFYFATQINDGSFVGTDTNSMLLTSPSLTGPWSLVPSNKIAGTNQFGFIQQLNDGSFIGGQNNIGIVTASKLMGPWAKINELSNSGISYLEAI